MKSTHSAGRHPVEVGTLIACAVTGTVHAVAATTPSTIQSSMGSALGGVWGGVFAVGSALALAGIFWRGGLEASLQLERSGLTAVCGALLAALAAIVVRVPITAEVAGPLVLGIGGGMGFRVWQISRVIQRANASARVRKWVRDAGVLGAGGGDDSGQQWGSDAAGEVVDGTQEVGSGHRRGIHPDGGNAGDESGAGGRA